MDAATESTYGRVFDLLAGNPEQIALTVACTLLAGLYLAVVGTWLPMVTLTQLVAAPSSDHADQMQRPGTSVLALLTLAVGGGMILTVLLGTLSAFVFGQLVPGVAASLTVGLITTFRLLSHARRADWRLRWDGGVFAVVTGAALLLGLWTHVISEFPSSDGDTQVVAYSDLHSDSAFHVYLASILQGTGLPLIDLYGSPFHTHAPVTHTGHAVLIGSLSTVLRVSPFLASTALWIIALVLLAWSAAVLLSRPSIRKRTVVLGSLCPLVWGPLTAPSFFPLSQPDQALLLDPLTAARMYWNISQALSTGLVAIALVLFDGYCREPDRSRGRLKLIALTALAMSVSGWIKPSLFIFYGPALIVTMLVYRVGLRDVLLVVTTLAAGVAVYLLPAWLVEVPDVPPWSVHPSREQTREVASFVVFGCGAALLLSLGPLWRSFGNILKRSDPQPITFAIVAMGGSLLFALLFREERFVGFRVFQPNIWWGGSACVVLLLPLVIRSAATHIAETRRSDWIVVSAFVIGAVQVLNGIVFAAAYPAIDARGYPSSFASALQAAEQSTSSETRFLLDPALAHPELASLLARPALFETAYMADGDRENLESWSDLFEEPLRAELRGWTHYDAALLHDESTAAQRVLQSLGWTGTELTDDYQLWTRSAASQSRDR